MSKPVSISERAGILDILRGIALFGICIANYPVFSFYVFQSEATQAAMPTAAIDKIIPFIHFALVDGKFYSLFSLLFGIGFSIILQNRSGRNMLPVFYRRLIILAVIGLAHSLVLWQGDILLLYALVGMILPLFRNVKDRNLVIIWGALILSPILIDLIHGVTDNRINPAELLLKKGIAVAEGYGITDQNFPNWLVVHTDFLSLLKYNYANFFFRWEGLLDSNRIFKVLGMFLLGYYVGRKSLYNRLEENRIFLKKIQLWGFVLGLPASCAHAYTELSPPADGPAGLLHPVFYAISVVPLSLAYTSTICLWYLNPGGKKRLQMFAAPGRMALTNYLLQSVIGVILFCGIGFGLGGKTGLAFVLLIAVAVYIFEIILSTLWLKHFQYGPVEWVWRQLTYGKRLKLRKEKAQSP